MCRYGLCQMRLLAARYIGFGVPPQPLFGFDNDISLGNGHFIHGPFTVAGMCVAVEI